jgi:hypothetical protein
MPPYWVTLITPVFVAQGLPHFKDVQISHIKATGAERALFVSAYPNTLLVDFTIDHLNIQVEDRGHYCQRRQLIHHRQHHYHRRRLQDHATHAPAKKETAFGDKD